ncbi:MAG: hypothetical protein AAGD96_27795, partial [Chloroflexota bacterium]
MYVLNRLANGSRLKTVSGIVLLMLFLVAASFQSSMNAAAAGVASEGVTITGTVTVGQQESIPEGTIALLIYDDFDATFAVAGDSPDGVADETTVDSATGVFSFSNVEDGFYRVVIMPPADSDYAPSESYFADVFEGEVEWIRNYGGSGNDTAQSIITTQDGGYAVMGYTNSTAGDITDKELAVNDYWLLKLDAQGEIQWTKTYGGSKDDRGQSVIQATDGGYAIVGYAMSSDGDGSKNEGFHDNWILRLDAAGEILWERSFGFSGHDHSYDVLQTADGGFFFAGFLDVQSSQGLGDTGKGDLLTRHGVGEYWGTKLDA